MLMMGKSDTTFDEVSLGIFREVVVLVLEEIVDMETSGTHF